jgi:PPOX class probable F420-dependent enzyme
MKLDNSLRAFLRQPLIARVTTIDPDGYPHTVPIWYILDGDDIVLATGVGAHKLDNIRRNPKGSVTIGGDVTEDETVYDPCYLFQGDLSIEKDPEQKWIKRIAYFYRKDHKRADQDLAEWGPHDVIRLKIRNVIKAM